MGLKQQEVTCMNGLCLTLTKYQNLCFWYLFTGMQKDETKLKNQNWTSHGLLRLPPPLMVLLTFRTALWQASSTIRTGKADV